MEGDGCKLTRCPGRHQVATLISKSETEHLFLWAMKIPQDTIRFLRSLNAYLPCFFPYLPPAIRGHVELFPSELRCRLENPVQYIVSGFLVWLLHLYHWRQISLVKSWATQQWLLRLWVGAWSCISLNCLSEDLQLYKWMKTVERSYKYGFIKVAFSIRVTFWTSLMNLKNYFPVLSNGYVTFQQGERGGVLLRKLWPLNIWQWMGQSLFHETL